MVKIAYDPTPLHHEFDLLELPDVTARLGFEHMQLTPHADFGPFFRYPKADDDLVRAFAKRASDAGVSIPALLPVQRISWPDEPERLAAVRNFTRIIQLAAQLEVPVINTEFSGRPERSEESEVAFYRSMEELLPVLETEGISINFDPHPDDFVEDGLEAWRVLRGLNDKRVGFVYVASHTFHYGNRAATLIPELGERLRTVYTADTFDHHASHGLRYISNPPGNAARVHQHLNIGDGDVDFAALFDVLRTSGFLDRDDALIVSNVFAEDDDWERSAAHQQEALATLINDRH